MASHMDLFDNKILGISYPKYNVFSACFQTLMACGDGLQKPVYQMANVHLPEQYQTVPATSSSTMTLTAQISPSSTTLSPSSQTVHQLSPSPTSSPMLSQTKQAGSSLSMELPPSFIFQPSKCFKYYIIIITIDVINNVNSRWKLNCRWLCSHQLWSIIYFWRYPVTVWWIAGKKLLGAAC